MPAWCSVAFSPDNLRIASSCDQSIKIWDVHTGQLLNILTGQNAKHSVDCCEATGQNVKHSVDCCEATGHTALVRCVAFSLDNLKIVSGSNDHSIKIWDAQSGQLLNSLTGHIKKVYTIALQPIIRPIDMILKNYIENLNQ
jgi:WD40 repeat protein